MKDSNINKVPLDLEGFPINFGEYAIPDFTLRSSILDKLGLGEGFKTNDELQLEAVVKYSTMMRASSNFLDLLTYKSGLEIHPWEKNYIANRIATHLIWSDLQNLKHEKRKDSQEKLKEEAALKFALLEKMEMFHTSDIPKYLKENERMDSFSELVEYFSANIALILKLTGIINDLASPFAKIFDERGDYNELKIFTESYCIDIKRFIEANNK